MRTFAQKLQQSRKSASCILVRSTTTTPGPRQRMIENHTVRPLLPLKAEGVETGSAASGSQGFGHDFSNIRIWSKQAPDSSKAMEPEGSSGIPPQLQASLESLTGMDPSGIRVHYNSGKPAQLDALAYTQMRDIHIGPGQEEHLPHEAWHAVQQMQGRVKPTMQAGDMSISDDASLEREADQMGAKIATMNPTRESRHSRMPTNSAGYNSVVQRKLKLTGTDPGYPAKFLIQMNTGSVQFSLDANGFVTPTDAKAVGKDEYAKKMIESVNAAQTVELNLVPKSDTLFIDSFSTGKVDFDDMAGLSSEVFRSWLLHFVVERFAVADYEKNKAKTTNPDFLKAHQAGHESQERFLKELYPKKTIKYKGEGFDDATKVVDASNNGSIDYYFDFTDVKYVFTQPIVAGKTLENITKSSLVVVK